MGIFKKIKLSNNKVGIYDYLDNLLEETSIQDICNRQINELCFLKLAISISASYIASAISPCDFKFYKNGKCVKDANYYKLNVSPNPNETASKLKYNLVSKLIKDGSALCVNINNYLYLADDYFIANDSIFGYVFQNLTVQGISIDLTFKKKNSLFFTLSETNLNKYLNPIDQKYQEILSSAVSIYKSAIAEKWKIKYDVMDSNREEIEKKIKEYVSNTLKKFITSDKPAVLPEGKYYNVEKFSNDKLTDTSDIRELRKDIFDMVAQTYKIPVSMLYGNVTNLKDVTNQFITYAVKPIAKMLSEEITRIFYSENEILNDSYVKVDISNISYRDIFDIADKVDKAISDGVASIDEARNLVEMPLINEAWSKIHWMTKNYAKVEDAMNDISNNTVSNTTDNSTMKGGDANE